MQFLSDFLQTNPCYHISGLLSGPTLSSKPNNNEGLIRSATYLASTENNHQPYLSLFDSLTMEQGRLKVLLVGKGAREHSLAWKLAQSPSVQHVYVVPGNGGTSELDNVSNISSVEANDYPALAVLAKDLGIGLVVAGPDDAVVDGIEGFFRESKIFPLCMIFS